MGVEKFGADEARRIGLCGKERLWRGEESSSIDIPDARVAFVQWARSLFVVSGSLTDVVSAVAQGGAAGVPSPGTPFRLSLPSDAVTLPNLHCMCGAYRAVGPDPPLLAMQPSTGKGRLGS